ncbi:MAG TPA: hypothetical protein VJV23_05175, partial [Candidatus Polarisedimenticolia bacterium]|nr:hypothetical protein [Candidatus Polarisedimenticolia bacterium]
MLLAAWRPPHVDPSSWGIVISLCALACALAPRREISTRSRWALAGAAALGCASLAASCQGLQSARTLVLFSAYGFAAWACAAHASGCPAGSPRRRGLDLAIAAAGTALATHGLYQAFYGFGRMAAALGPDAPEALRSRIASGRAVGTLGLPGSLAGLLILSIPVTAGLLLASRASRSPWRAVA